MLKQNRDKGAENETYSSGQIFVDVSIRIFLSYSLYEDKGQSQRKILHSRIMFRTGDDMT